MSRKDPRSVLVLHISPTELAWLRQRAQGRSLADALRRAIELALPATSPPPALQHPRRLPVQLPRQTRANLARLAEDENLTLEETTRALLAHAMARNPV